MTKNSNTTSLLRYEKAVVSVNSPFLGKLFVIDGNLFSFYM